MDYKIQGDIAIAPSILAADFAHLAAEIKAVEDGGADWIHVDVMDGHFVPNLTIGPVVVQSLKRVAQKPLDVHLMISPVDHFIPSFADAGADRITIHVESGFHLHRSLELIKKTGKKIGVALNPATPLSLIEPVLDMVDLILVMTVDPGFGGQKLLPRSLEKVKAARAMINASGRAIDLQVDGGVTTGNAKDLVAAGANILVAGSAIFGASQDQYANIISSLRGA